MGAWIPKKPDKNQPKSSILIREMMQAAILDRIDEEGLTAAEIADKYPGFRSAYVQAMRSDSALFGFNRLCSMCEAMGLMGVMEMRFVNSSREQARLMEAA
ncbi:hypothetical protein [Rhizobium laguerreae]|jgi:hypothetical protein|uniref:hypothetical protein n=1 Tax=Rhizobium laguerreae TaxID=1076926 RepID=UPI001C8FF456|nr:hypothetical protein [Rhizobium laguerreae]MBY3363736.1 hypothetical protein [Rhizobium laguerreae]